MQTLENIEQQQWQESVIKSFLDMVKATDGDFDVLGRLAQAVSDTSSQTMMVEFLSLTPQGKRAFQEYPRLGNIDLHQLHQLPENTFGYAYANHMLKNGLKPLQYDQVDNDFQFLAAHITETHDLWHVITGSNTNILGEIQLESFYVAQLYASRFWLSLLAKNLLKAVVFDIEVSNLYMEAISRGWLMAKQAKPLFGIEWNTLWEVPLEELRASLNIVPFSDPINHQ